MNKVLLLSLCCCSLVNASFPSLPGWDLADTCSEQYPTIAETSETPFATATSACDGTHDPTHLISTKNGDLVFFYSGQGGACQTKNIIVKYMRQGTNVWKVGGPMYVVFERGVREYHFFFMFLSCHSNYKNIARIPHLHCKKITRISILECALDIDLNSNTNARTQVRRLRRFKNSCLDQQR